tara:strand:- start:136 stop:480 length:345 start_codon:yes stop_codon:yes gene_type:complete
MDPISSDFLIDTLANTPFIMFLVWQFMISRRDYKELKKEAKEEQEKIRARFEAIIKDLNADRDSITKGVELKITDLDAKTASLEKSIRKLFAVIDKLKESINDLKIKERIRDLT